jgi:hypothetical protein
MDKSLVTFDVVVDNFNRFNYTFNTEPFHLNIGGIRDTNRVNSFNDIIFIAYNDGVNNIVKTFTATTDPGLSYLNTPLASNGTAILKEGQIIDAFKLGLHQGKYKALVQNVDFTVYRDNNRDNVLNTNVKTETGMFGINLHHANANYESKQIDKWSAGCQVIANPDDFETLLSLADKSVACGYKTFNYTLFTKEQFFA